MKNIYVKKLLVTVAILFVFIATMVLLAYISQSSIFYSLISVGILVAGCYIFSKVIIPYTNAKYRVEPSDRLLPISQEPIISRALLSKYRFMFDQEYFYAVSPKETIKIPLKNITQITKGNVRANNRKAWDVVCIMDDGTKYSFCFLHNYTLWNKNFQVFLSQVKKKNPSSKIENFGFFTM